MSTERAQHLIGKRVEVMAGHLFSGCQGVVQAVTPYRRRGYDCVSLTILLDGHTVTTRYDWDEVWIILEDAHAPH